MSCPFVKGLLRRQTATGVLTPRPVTGGPVRALDLAAQAWLGASVQPPPAATLAEVSAAWQAQGGRPVGQTCLWQVPNEHGQRRKKKSARQRA